MSRFKDQDKDKDKNFRERYLHVFQYSWRAIGLVWSTSKVLTVIFGALTVLAGLMPTAIAYVGKLIVDQVLVAADSGLTADRNLAFAWVGLEAGLVVVLAGIQRGLSVCQSLLRAQRRSSRQRHDFGEGADAGFGAV